MPLLTMGAIDVSFPSVAGCLPPSHPHQARAEGPSHVSDPFRRQAG